MIFMASKGNKRHMKGLTATKYLSVKRKVHVYVAKPNAGRHSLERSIPLVLFAEKIGVAATRASATKLIKKKAFLVNKKTVADPKYPIGLNDYVEVEGQNEAYLVGINERSQVSIEKRGKENAEKRLCKVVQKFKAKGGAIMIRLHDGTVIKASNDIRVNDSVIIDPKNNIREVIRLGNGRKCLVISGVHVGTSGTIKEIKEGTAKTNPSVLVESGNWGFETLTKNVMVVG